MDLTQRARALLSGVDDIAESLIVSVWEHLPGYDSARMDREDLSQVVASNLRALLTAVSERRAPNAIELAPAIALGERRAIQGVPIEGVLASWHTAERILLQHLTVSGSRVDGPEVADLARRLGVVADAMTDACTDAYRRTRHEAAGHLDQIATDLVSRLAGGEPLDPVDVEERARLVGVHAQASHRAAAIGLAGASEPLQVARAQRMILDSVQPRLNSRVLTGSKGLVLLMLSEDVEGLVPALRRAARRPGVPSGLVIGLGEPRPRLGEAQGSCRESVAALEAGLAMGADRTVVEFRTVVLEVLLLDNPLDARQLASTVLGPLGENHTLLETLRTLLSSGLSARTTARRLSIHENTVANRVRRILSLMGLDSTAQLTRADILLALRVQELAGGAAPQRSGRTVGDPRIKQPDTVPG